jgi:hypothetical protein
MHTKAGVAFSAAMQTWGWQAGDGMYGQLWLLGPSARMGRWDAAWVCQHDYMP